jgi:hypothetical protein
MHTVPLFYQEDTQLDQGWLVWFHMRHLIFENVRLRNSVHKRLQNLSFCWFEEEKQMLNLPEETYNDFDPLEAP